LRGNESIAPCIFIEAKIASPPPTPHGMHWFGVDFMALQALAILPCALVRIVKKGERKLELRSIGFSSRV
jgi:hypothetical protein